MSASLIYQPPVALPARHWPDAVSALVAGRADSARYQVLGGPGTGKSALLVDIAVARIRAGVNPESMLVLTHSRRAAVALRDEISAALADGDSGARAARQPLVRTVHSYAFGVLRLQSAATETPPPRLITSAEQDVIIRELLRGNVEDEADGAPSWWPTALRPAVLTRGFAKQVREMMSRASERGIGPEDLVTLGRRHSRPEWVAVGKLASQYEQVMLLRGAVGTAAPQATAPILDAAELVGAALGAFATDRALLDAQRSEIRTVLVDDAQHLDPQMATLVRVLTHGADLAVVAGDPDQVTYGFRGADSAFLTSLGAETGWSSLPLTVDHRHGEQVAALCRRIGAPLTGPRAPVAQVSGARDETPGDAQVRVFGSTASQAAAVADLLRRAHLQDDVPWSQMAVIARSVPSTLPALRRALSSAGVPLVAASAEVPVAQHRTPLSLLLVVRALTGELTTDDAVTLVTGPVGSADPVALRRLYRALRRVSGATDVLAADLLVAALANPESDALVAGCSEVEIEPLIAVRRALLAARRVRARSGDIQEILWAAWNATRLPKRLLRDSAGRGSTAEDANRELDAVVGLFDAAGQYSDQLPGANLDGFVEYLLDQHIAPTPQRPAVGVTEAVTIISAHAAAGRQWEVVAVVDVQEGVWPNLRVPGDLVGTSTLLDVLDGLGEHSSVLSRSAPLLTAERRLLYSACSRARGTVLLSAVESTTTDVELVPSRFLEELAAVAAEVGGTDTVVQTATPRVLALPRLVAELRAVVCSPTGAITDQVRQQAARQLARLASHGVPGAHPSTWFGLAPVSTMADLRTDPDAPVALSPSTVEQLTACPLRWMLERHGGRDGDSTVAVAGTVVHAVVQAIAGHVPPEQISAALRDVWPSLEFDAPWFAEQELRRTEAMLSNFSEWLRGSRGELTEIGVEIPVDVVLPPHHEGAPSVRITGRIDRLERDALGRVVVIDVKTGKTPVTKDGAQEHAQLATYQVALAAQSTSPDTEPGGAQLVYVAKAHNKTGATTREQSALTPDAVEQWRGVIGDAASATAGPEFIARINEGCSHCPLVASCPAQARGQAVTQ